MLLYVYQFPIAVVKNYYKFRVSKQYKFIKFWSSEFWNASCEANIKDYSFWRL